MDDLCPPTPNLMKGKGYTDEERQILSELTNHSNGHSPSTLKLKPRSMFTDNSNSSSDSATKEAFVGKVDNMDSLLDKIAEKQENVRRLVEKFKKQHLKIKKKASKNKKTSKKTSKVDERSSKHKAQGKSQKTQMKKPYQHPLDEHKHVDFSESKGGRDCKSGATGQCLGGYENAHHEGEVYGHPLDSHFDATFRENAEAKHEVGDFDGYIEADENSDGKCDSDDFGISYTHFDKIQVENSPDNSNNNNFGASIIGVYSTMNSLYHPISTTSTTSCMPSSCSNCVFYVRRADRIG
jgi:hypothetical protein